MSILEDLDLMELLNELPTGTDFDLDDILSEFSTPGLFTATKEEEAETAVPVMEAEEIAEDAAEEIIEAVSEEIVEESLPEVPDMTDTAEETIPDVTAQLPIAAEEIEEPAPVVEVEEFVPVTMDDTDDDMTVVPDLLIKSAGEADYEHSDNTLFGDKLGLCDILFEFGTATEEAVDSLSASQMQIEDEEDDVRIYVPENTSIPAEVNSELGQNTVLFEASNLTEEAESVPTESKIAAQPKAPGFFARAATAIKGLFGSKKAAAPVVQPMEEEQIPLFVQDLSAADEEIPVIELTEESAEANLPAQSGASMSEADLLFLFAEEALGGEEAVEVPAKEELDAAAEEVIPVFACAIPTEEAVPAEAPEQQEITDESAESAESAEADHYDDSALFGDPLGISEILFEFGSADTEANHEPTVLSAVNAFDAAEEEDIKVYTPVEIPVAQAAEEQPEPTIVFDAIDLSAEPAPAEIPTTAEMQKAPGFFAKAAGLVAGLFASKKAAKTVVPATRPVSAAASREDPFANLTDLFSATSSDELSGLDDLMLELELQAEREAELAKEAAARDAAERLAREEQQRMLELDAQRLAQAEADAEAAAQREETAVVLEAPALEELPLQTDTPVYDFTAVDLSSQTQEYTAPQMNIAIDEEVSEEVGDLLEMPDVDRNTASEETPEEAAARKKKEDDSLHYKPEESTAKAVSSHIRNRFGAAFTAFTESSDDSDDEEALGPELPAGKAYRFFNKYINGYRFRLRISTILCVILGWISLDLPVLGSLKNPAAAAAMCLMILLTVMLAGADILAVGVRNLLRKKANIHSLVAISCFASVIDAIVIIATKGVGGYLPFCGVSAISMCFAIYGSLLYCRSQRLNFKTLDRAAEPMTISVDYGIVEEDTSTVYRTPGHPEGYIHHSEEEDLSETVFGIVAPILIPAIPVMTVIAALFAGGFSDFFHIMAAMFAAAASFGALIAFPLPYFLVQKELYATKAAIAGWAGVRELGRVSNMIVSDRDLFPDETVSIKSVRIVDNVPPQLTLSYMCSVVVHSESCLVPAFTQLAENNDCELLEVENFQCHEAGGLSAEIGPDSVLVASHSYMKLQGFRIPARKKDSENALFLAVNGHVIAYIIVDYKPIKSVRAGLQSALRGNVEMIFAARDFNVTPLLISKKFKSTTETLRFPSYSQRYEITSQVNSETAACAAVVYRKSFYSYAVVVEKARYLYNSVSWGVILSTASSIIGVLFMFIMALTGGAAAITVGRLLVFMLLWLIPTLALTVSITK